MLQRVLFAERRKAKQLPQFESLLAVIFAHDTAAAIAVANDLVVEGRTQLRTVPPPHMTEAGRLRYPGNTAQVPRQQFDHQPRRILIDACSS